MDRKELELRELEAKTHESSFWNDNVAAQKVIAQVNEKKEWVEGWSSLHQLAQDTAGMIELAAAENEPGVEAALQQDIEKIAKGIERLELKNMLSGVDDEKNALLTIHSGAGGTEAQDLSEMLLRMYTRWCERS